MPYRFPREAYRSGAESCGRIDASEHSPNADRQSNSPYAGRQLVMESALDTIGGLHPAAAMPAASPAPPCAELHLHMRPAHEGAELARSA